MHNLITNWKAQLEAEHKVFKVLQDGFQSSRVFQVTPDYGTQC